MSSLQEVLCCCYSLLLYSVPTLVTEPTEELETKVSFMLTVGVTDLCEGGEVELVKAVDIQRVLLLGIRFELRTPKGQTV